MLKSLYEYATRNGLTLPPGYVNKTVKAFILLNSDGSFQDVEICEDETVIAPDIGSLANGTDKCNVLLEKRSIVVPEEESKKSRFFQKMLEEGSKWEPILGICMNSLRDEAISSEIRRRLDEKKVKSSDRISFKVDYRSILESDKIKDWWRICRGTIIGSGGTKGSMSRCLITGELTVPLLTTTPINGLKSVGGHARGDALICFDKNAFCSYGLKKALNAPVSEEAFAAVKAALDDLLLPENSPVLAGMKFVHWYDRTIEPEEDPILLCGEFFTMEEDDERNEEEQASDIERFKEQHTEESTEERTEKIRNAAKAANRLIRSVKNGDRAYMPEDIQYHILLLSGVNGRVMIRRYERGRFVNLQDKLIKWHEDLSLISREGGGEIPSCKLTARLMRLMKRQKRDSRPFERMAKELSGITPAIITGILSGGVLPDSVAIRALSTIRSQLIDEDTSELDRVTVSYAYQWLKVWLIRNRKKGGVLLKGYNPGYPGTAYHCGAMLAVYEEIQNTAMRMQNQKVNVTVTQRYFASAMQTPALVLGTLSRMSVHHLEKIKNEWIANEMKNHLRQISTSIYDNIPTTLNLEQQSEFALGYYQMGAELNRIRIERTAKNKTKEVGRRP